MKKSISSFVLFLSLFAFGLSACGGSTEPLQSETMAVKFIESDGTADVVTFELNADQKLYTVESPRGGSILMSVTGETVDALDINVLANGTDSSRYAGGDGEVKSRLCGCRDSLTDPMPANPCSCEKKTCMCVSGPRPELSWEGN